jgi:hypothetical protein
MIGIAKFSIVRPDALAPYLGDEMRVLGSSRPRASSNLHTGARPGRGAISSSRDPASTPSENESTPFPSSSRTS